MGNNPPTGMPRVLARVSYDDVAPARTFLCDAFGFSEHEQSRVSDAHGHLSLTELVVNDSRIMLGRSGNHGQQSPQRLGGNPQMRIVYIDDAHHARALAGGAKLLMALNDAPLGDRRYEVEDCEGHRRAFHEHTGIG